MAIKSILGIVTVILGLTQIARAGGVTPDWSRVEGFSSENVALKLNNGQVESSALDDPFKKSFNIPLRKKTFSVAYAFSQLLDSAPVAEMSILLTTTSLSETRLILLLTSHGSLISVSVSILLVQANFNEFFVISTLVNSEFNQNAQKNQTLEIKTQSEADDQIKYEVIPFLTGLSLYQKPTSSQPSVSFSFSSTPINSTSIRLSISVGNLTFVYKYALNIILIDPLSLGRIGLVVKKLTYSLELVDTLRRNVEQEEVMIGGLLQISSNTPICPINIGWSRDNSILETTSYYNSTTTTTHSSTTTYQGHESTCYQLTTTFSFLTIQSVRCPSSFPFFDPASSLCLYKCLPSTYPSSQKICLPCFSDCFECTGEKEEDCVKCSEGRSMEEGKCVCNEGSREQKGKCIGCSQIVPFCQTCSLLNTCLTCFSAYYLNQTECHPCPVGCTSCISHNNCSSCMLNFILIKQVCHYFGKENLGGTSKKDFDRKNASNFNSNSNSAPMTMNSVCSSLITGCDTCITVCVRRLEETPRRVGSKKACTSYTSCTSCLKGSYLASATSCVHCPTLCVACSGPTACTSCKPTFIVIGGICTCNTAAGYWLSPTTGTCLACTTFVPNCQTCAYSGAAVICSTAKTGIFSPILGYYLVNSTTTALCPSLCTACTSPASCSSCISTFVPIGGICQCDTANGYKLDTVTNTCNLCSYWVPLCLTCSWDAVVTTTMNCLSCTVGYYVTSPSTCSCDPGQQYFIDPITLKCLPCSTIHVNCLSCSYNGAYVDCSSSIPGTYLTLNATTNEVAPVACLSGCLTCANGVSCSACDPGLNWVGAVGSSACYCGPSCTSCQTLVSDSNCIQCNATSCTNCATGQYPTSGTPSCTACPPGCIACSSSTTCTICLLTFSLISNLCSCASPLLITNANPPTCQPCSYFVANCKTCSQSGGITTCSACITTYFLASSTLCSSCIPHCDVCSGLTGCTTCTATFSYISSTCQCNFTAGLFINAGGTACNSCPALIPNCQICTFVTLANLTVQTQCSTAMPYYYVDPGSLTCSPCNPGCITCSITLYCSNCMTGTILTGGNCPCDPALNYVLNASSGWCVPCGLSNCITCSNLTDCSNCDPGYYSAALNGCKMILCGDGVVSTGEECDDGNVVDSDGCSSFCTIETGYVCPGSPSLCQLSPDFRLTPLSNRIVLTSCNTIVFTFAATMIDRYNVINFGEAITVVNGQMLQNMAWNLIHLRQTSYTLEYTFTYSQTIQGLDLQFYFDFSTLSNPIAQYLPQFFYIFTVNPNNNIAAYYTRSGTCQSKAKTDTVLAAVQYGGIAVMIASAIPAKIVGLELMGVLQLAVITLANIDEVNVLLMPLMGMKGVSGLSVAVATSKSQVPNRVAGIGYDPNFINNCNVMLLVVLAQVVVAVTIFLVSILLKVVSDTPYKIAKRMLKEVLLTLLLFNAFNFAFSAGIHFNYALTSDQMYTLGSVAAVSVMAAMAIMGLMIAFLPSNGFGEFKDKFKPSFVQQNYFVVTIAYRMALGYATAFYNQNQLSTLIILGFSLFFLIYNLVNLPFKHAYMNYRANLCHFTQFLTLFIAMFYRSMKSTADPASASQIYPPAYLEIAALLLCFVVSTGVLFYEIYQWIKQCMQNSKKQKQIKNSQGNVTIDDFAEANKNIENIKSVENIFE